MITRFKLSMLASAVTVVAGLAAPAMADTMYVSINSSDGVFNDPNAVSGGSAVYFGGIIQYEDQSQNNFVYNVFCDDPGNDVVVPGTYTYQLENEAYANAYLAPLAGNTNNTITEEIAGLTAYGLANPTNATLDEYVQEAIWHLMGANITLSGATLSGVNNLLGFGTANWDSYWGKLAALGWSYGQLIDTTDDGCNDSGQVTYLSCQTQGQMYLYGGLGLPPTENIPEPGTMALLGAGLLGLAGMTWLRRKSADRGAA